MLLDEVEKAHRDVMNLFYQVFDRGFMRDGEGREIDFRCVFRSIRSRIGIEVRSAIRIHSINRELNFFLPLFNAFFSLLSTTGGFFLSDSP